ncbi:MAG: winged helix-turn-helix domain-containing protein [bacterium]|nr:winged helix-turn-helix domain-containing protein [bacterium]
MLPKQKEIEIPLLQVLVELGGEGKPEQIYPRVTERFPSLSKEDLQKTLKKGQIFWINRIQWARQDLVTLEQIDNSKRGIWRITEKGRERLNIEKPSLPILSKVSKPRQRRVRDKDTNEEITSNAALFTYYSQEENRFTNGLLSILNLSRIESPRFVTDLFNDTLSLNISRKPLNFKVLRDISEQLDDGKPDGEISNENLCLLFETKVRSGSLNKDQIRGHLKKLRQKKSRMKRLILLTPDDSVSSYIRQLTQQHRPYVVHLEWRRIFDFLETYTLTNSSLLAEIIKQFLDQIHSRIFTQDIAAVIVKVNFIEKSGVNPETYLEEMRRGKWDDWHTPRQYKQLDGNGRKLILYDSKKKALTMEVEIKQVKKTRSEEPYPWSNKFVPNTIRIYRNPVRVEEIHKLEGFENFGRQRGACRNVTREQYNKLSSFGNKDTRSKRN